MVIRSLFHSETCCDPATSSTSSSSVASSATVMTMMMMHSSSSPTPPAPLETISLLRTTTSSPTAASSRPLTPRSALAATYATYVVRVHTRHGIKTISFDLLAGFFTYTAKKAAEDLGISSRTLIRVCRSLGIRRWPYLGFRSEKNVERIRQEAIENLRRKLEREGAETAASATHSATHSTTSCLRGASAKRLLQVKLPQMANAATAAVAPTSNYYSSSQFHHHHQQQQQQQNHCINTIVSPSAAVHHHTQHPQHMTTLHNHLAQNQSQIHHYSYNQTHNQIQMPLLTPPHAHHAFNLETEPTLSPRRVHSLHHQHHQQQYQHYQHYTSSSPASSAASSPSSSSSVSSPSPSPASSSMPSLNVLMEASILTAFKHEMTRPAESPRAAESNVELTSSSADSADAQHHARTMSMRDILSHTAMAA